MSSLIVIPYRNRKEHIEYYLKNTLPNLNKYLDSFKIVIVEQLGDELFNRGKLINIAAIEFKDDYQYLITQDVDINPTSNVIAEHYNISLKDKQVHGIYTSFYDTMGGICKFNMVDFHTINGFPNNFWGWGVEDRALQNRAYFYDLYKTKFIHNKDPNKQNFFKIFSDNHDRTVNKKYKEKTNFEYHKFININKEEQLKHIMDSGIHNCQYTIINKYNTIEKVEWLQVDLGKP